MVGFNDNKNDDNKNSENDDKKDATVGEHFAKNGQLAELRSARENGVSWDCKTTSAIVLAAVCAVVLGFVLCVSPCDTVTEISSYDDQVQHLGVASADNGQ